MVEQLRFLTNELSKQAANEYGTPLYIYSEEKIRLACQKALDFPNAFGLTVRYAVKANPLAAFLNIADQMGLHFDASSEFEVARILAAGIAPEKIQLTAQQFPKHFLHLLKDDKIRFNACSLHQLEKFGQHFPGREVSVRLNPGLGSGSTRKTNVGGPSSSFGIWHEYIKEIDAIAKKYSLVIKRVHTHIGSGTDPEVWQKVAQMTLKWALLFPEVDTVNLGGGFKVARMSDEKYTNLQTTGAIIKEEFLKVAESSGKKFKLEIEPGTFIAANTGVHLAEVDDIIDTGADGFKFLKLNTGMDALTRPALYAARHSMVVINNSKSGETADYVVTGHCCESGDLFTVGADEELAPRTMAKAKIGDLVAIEGAGAYCSSMNLRNYNSFPACTELLLTLKNEFKVIRRAENFEEILVREKL